MNSVSERTKNENLLRTRTRTFKDNIKSSENRMRASSSLHNLAGKLYSQKTNTFFTPKKSVDESSKNQPTESKNQSTVSKNQSTGKLLPEKSLINPEKILLSTANSAISGLSLRASHISSFSEMNTTLLKEKHDLQRKIVALKEGIVLEKKKLNSANYNRKKNRNDIENVMTMYEQAHEKSLKLNQNINATSNDCRNFIRDIKMLKEKISTKKSDIQREQKNINNLQTETKNLRSQALHQEKLRNSTKADLSKSQRVMQSASIYSKQLQNQKAMLMLQINQFVGSNKI